MLTHIDKCKEIREEFGLSAARNFLIIVGCIIQGKTVNLYDLKDEVGKISEKGESDSLSHYKRLTRFFQDFKLSILWGKILLFGLSFLKYEIKEAYLDGTEWSIGKFKLHVLVLAVDYQGVAIPIYFSIHNHKGVLCEEERIGFIKKAQAEVAILEGVTIIADREFIGSKWFGIFTPLSLFLLFGCEKGNISIT